MLRLMSTLFLFPVSARIDSVMWQLSYCTFMLYCIRCKRYYILNRYRYSYDNYCEMLAEYNLVHAQADLYSSGERDTCTYKY